ncbi:MAG TPA: ABC transporter permease [Candidatus Acidoferrales bacterium]|nr:ABC transporter permease [Candidatus Acidoferrales bacterium]
MADAPASVPFETGGALLAQAGAARARLLDALAVLLRNRLAMVGLILVVTISSIALLGPHLVVSDPLQMNLSERLSKPSSRHWLGTDAYGRDILARVVFGARIAMQVALGAVFLAVAVGVPLGAVSGYAGGALDSLIMRMIDAFLAFPGRLLAIALVAAMGPSFLTFYVAIGINSVPGYARVVRGGVLAQKAKEYVEAAHMTGESGTRILFSQILPNCMAPILVLVTLDFAHAILVESSLSFLGLGFPPPAPSWGLMLSEARGYMEVAPHVAIVPGAVISLTILGFNLIGDGLRDIFDPREYER